MASPAFPNVPQPAGVPPVQRDVTNPGTGTETALSQDGDEIAVQGLTEWGVYTKDGSKALDPDTIISMGYSAEYRIADFPIEEGGFESYDKVGLPFETRIVMTKGGSSDDRRAFLSAVEELRVDRELYSVVTPERTYPSANIARVSIDRSREQGAGLISVELMLAEVRTNVTTTFSNSKEPASADTKSDGAVQPQAAPPDVQARAQAKVASPDVAVAGGAPSFFNQVAGAAMQVVPLVAGLPSQSLTVNLASQAVQMVFSQKRTGLFADISVAGAAIAQGVMCRDGVPLLSGVSSLLPGDLAFVDMIGNADPVFSELGDRFKLLWAG